MRCTLQRTGLLYIFLGKHIHHAFGGEPQGGDHRQAHKRQRHKWIDGLTDTQCMGGLLGVLQLIVHRGQTLIGHQTRNFQLQLRDDLPIPDGYNAAVVFMNPVHRKSHVPVIGTDTDDVVAVVGHGAPVFLGIGLAYLVNLPASLFQKLILGKSQDKRREKLSRWISILIGYVIFFGAIALLIFLVIPKVVVSVKSLAANFDSYYARLVEWATEFWEDLNLSESVTDYAVALSDELLAKLEDFLMVLVPKLLNITLDAVKLAAHILLAIGLSVYLLIDKSRLLAHSRRFIRAVFSEDTAERVIDIFSYTNKTFRGYFGGQLISSTLIGIECYIGMRIFGMPYPEMISFAVGALAMLPILGPWLSTVPSAFIILMASPDKPSLALWFVLLVIIIQQIDNNFTYPLVVGDAVGLSSAWVMIAIIVFSGLFGFLGLVFAVPVTAVIYRLVGDWTNARAREKGVPIVSSVPNVQYERQSRIFKFFRKLRKKK